MPKGVVKTRCKPTVRRPLHVTEKKHLSKDLKTKTLLCHNASASIPSLKFLVTLPIRESSAPFMPTVSIPRHRASPAVIAVVAALLIWPLVQPGFAVPPSSKASVAGFVKAMAAEDHAEAKRLADQILPHAATEDRRRVATAYGRILLAQGDVEAVRGYLATMTKEPLDGDGRQLMTIYAAWLDAIDGRPEAAIESLETFIRGHEHTLAAAEAADVLAILYLARDNQGAAKRAVDYGLATLKYLAVKTDYLEALLRRRLVPKVATSEAERLYAAAEKLRQEGKHQDAAMRFALIRQQHGDSVWADAAGFRIGQCLTNMGRRPQAVEHWQGFVKENPSGPWRGQAHVALIDDVLESSLDVAAATTEADEALATLSAPLSEKAEASWAEAAFDLYLRQAIIAFVDQRHDAASKACSQALAIVPKNSPGVAPATRGHDSRAVALDCLAGLARQQRGILPEDVAKAASRKTHAALSLGCINLVLGRGVVAASFFGTSGGRGSEAMTTSQRAFALFGAARATLADASSARSARKSGTPMQSGALRLYLQSLAEFPSGSWHDETLRDVAFLVESGSGDALRHWNDLIRLFPSSRHAAEALYRVGLLSEATQKPAEAIRAFEALVKEHPSSRCAGDAAVRVIDVRLEQEYDLPGATRLAEAAVAWLERQGAREPVGTGLDAVIGGASPESHHLAPAFDAMQPSVISAAAKKAIEALPTAEQSAYTIYVRAGLVEYLLDRPEAAVAFFEKAKPLAPPPKRDAVVIGHVPTGIEQLIEVAKSGKVLTPTEARAGDAKAKLIMMLADVHVAGREWTKAIELCDKVIESKKFSATPHQRSWAYHQKASAIYGIPDCKNAYEDFLEAEKASPSAPWAAESLLFAGCIANNFLKDDALALTQYQAVVARHPTSEVASKAAFFVGVTHESNKDWDRAKAAYIVYLKKYSNAPWTNLVKNNHLPEVERESAEAQSPDVRATKP